MNGAIYQIFVGNNNIAANLAWRTVSEDERKAVQEKERASREAVGAKEIVSCDSAWTDEMHPWWGVLQYPDMQARIEHTRTLREIGWLDVVDAFTLLGTAMSGPETPHIPNPIYKLWIVKNDPAVIDFPDDLQSVILEKHAALFRECSSQMLLVCDSSWCNEAYTSFGLEVYPDFESLQSIHAQLVRLGWRKGFNAITYLGIPASSA